MSILIVEDNPVTAKIVEFNLKKNGYETIYAKSGKDAIENLQSNIKIKLVITDILMPEMNGLELSESLSKLYNFNTIFVSGYSANIIAEKGIIDSDVLFIQKPFTKADLLTVITKALNENV